MAPGDRVRERAAAAVRIAAGDRTGLALWLALAAVLATTWRAGFFLTDSYTVANTMVAVGDGRLAIREPRYTLAFGTLPGLHEHGGSLYGRNYGQVAIALPVLFALRAGAVVASPALIVAGLWSLAVLAVGRILGGLLGRTHLRTGAGVVALAAFAVNVVLAVPIDATRLPLVALQATGALAGAAIGLLCYRILASEGRRVAVAAGVATVLATPVAFWATIPKRHVVVTALAFASLYCFAVSRRRDGRRGHLGLAGAYAGVGLVAWVHAFEGLILAAGLIAVDRTTERAAPLRLAAAGTGFVVGLLPMALTNLLISGSPLTPPRLLPKAGVGDVELAPAVEGTASDGAGGADVAGGNEVTDAPGTPGEASAGTPEGESGAGPTEATEREPAEGETPSGTESGSGTGVPGTDLAGEALSIAAFAGTIVAEGLAAVTDPDRLWHVFVRSGRIPGVKYVVNDQEAVELTVLESAPVLGGLAVTPVLVARALVRRGDLRGHEPWRPGPALAWLRSLSPPRQTDLLAATWGLILTVVYLSRLPLHSQITVRYLLPVMPLCVYLLSRVPAVVEGVESDPTTAAAAYAFGAVGGGAVISAVLGALDVALGEAMQFHALVGLAAAVAAGAVIAGRSLSPVRVSTRTVAAALGTTAGVTTAFLLTARIEYFPFGRAVLGVTRALADLLPVF